MFKKLFIFLILQHLFSPSVWNQSPVCSDWLAGRSVVIGQLLRDVSEMSQPLAYNMLER